LVKFMLSAGQWDEHIIRQHGVIRMRIGWIVHPAAQK
jgi:hypothetical protein